MSSVALIIRSFNEEAHIGRLLTGAQRQTRPPDRIVLVDSGSTDRTAAIAREFGAEVVDIAPEEFSFGRALNVGIEAAEESVMVLASAHVYPVYDTWLQRLVEPFEDDRVALSYGRQQTPSSGRFSEQRLLEQWFPEQSVTDQRHPFCNNANAAIRRSTWEGRRYDEQLTGLEDLEWAKHVIETGLRISYVAEAPIVHVHNERFNQVLNRYRREAIAHKLIYHEQEMSMGTAVNLAAANILGDYVAALRTARLTANLLDIPKFRIAQFLGTYRGFSQSGPVTMVLKRRFYYPSNNIAAFDASGESVGQRIDYDR